MKDIIINSINGTCNNPVDSTISFHLSNLVKFPPINSINYTNLYRERREGVTFFCPVTPFETVVTQLQLMTAHTVFRKNIEI